MADTVGLLLAEMHTEQEPLIYGKTWTWYSPLVGQFNEVSGLVYTYEQKTFGRSKCFNERYVYDVLVDIKNFHLEGEKAVYGAYWNGSNNAARNQTPLRRQQCG